MKRILFVIALLMSAMLACQMAGLPSIPQSQPTPAVRFEATPPVLPTAADPAEMGSTLRDDISTARISCRFGGWNCLL